MQVLKFGGSSIGSVNSIYKISKILRKECEKSKIVVVVSAIGGTTDKLLKAAYLSCSHDKAYKDIYEIIYKTHKDIVEGLFEEDKNSECYSRLNTLIETKLKDLKQLLEGIYLINELSAKTRDKLLSFGEIIASNLMYYVLKSRKFDVVLKNSQDLIVTDSNFTSANVIFEETNQNITQFFASSTAKITLLPGFVSKSKSKELTTLGRGGSDYTAAIIASAIQAKELQIWTDVSGMYTTNPKVVKQAKPIKELSYQEAIELSHFGAKVLYPPTILPILNQNIPLTIKNTFYPNEEGTKISNQSTSNHNVPIKGISNIDDIALLTLQGHGMIGVPGFSKRLFETLAQEKINIILITQASSEHSICFVVEENDASQAKQLIDATFEYEIAHGKIEPILMENNLSIIAIVGDNMKNRQGISGKMFSALGKNNINIRAIAQGSSERNISAVIDKNNVKKALNTLHERFFEANIKQINLFVIGVGNVGKRLLAQIRHQEAYLKKHLKINLRIIGLSNSRKMLFDPNGINLENWEKELLNGEKANLIDFFDHSKALNLRNSILVDITANQNVAMQYTHYLKQNIAVVACNKIANSTDYAYYKKLKEISKYNKVSFLYETNVGAGLPIIDTLNHLITSGDKIKSIHAVLSGSLNYIFNHFNDKTTFYDIVKQAQKEGYTEPDPRIDLSGTDVMRKLIILARESGYKMELEEITSNHFLTENAMKANGIEDFYKTLIAEENYYQKLYQSSANKGCQLKFVAELHNGVAKIGLQEIAKDHPFYNLKGKDNIVMFYTQRYAEQPLIIKGAGAGKEVTASGLFADIIRIANK